MAESKEQKSLEMRVAELEDKLSKMHITEEEMKAYQKVSSLVGAPGANPVAGGCIADCNIGGGCINECTIRASPYSGSVRSFATVPLYDSVVLRVEVEGLVVEGLIYSAVKFGWLPIKARRLFDPAVSLFEAARGIWPLCGMDSAAGSQIYSRDGCNIRCNAICRREPSCHWSEPP